MFNMEVVRVGHALCFHLYIYLNSHGTRELSDLSKILDWSLNIT